MKGRLHDQEWCQSVGDDKAEFVSSFAVADGMIRDVRTWIEAQDDVGLIYACFGSERHPDLAEISAFGVTGKHRSVGVDIQSGCVGRLELVDRLSYCMQRGCG